jgi:hypothetical protein
MATPVGVAWARTGRRNARAPALQTAARRPKMKRPRASRSPLLPVLPDRTDSTDSTMTVPLPASPPRTAGPAPGNEASLEAELAALRALHRRRAAGR